jgi:predicted ATP-dependent endonuclease of OLD family
VVELVVRGYRTVLDVTLRPGPLTVLVGEANAGKSNLLAAIRHLLDPGRQPPHPSERVRDSPSSRVASPEAPW